MPCILHPLRLWSAVGETRTIARVPSHLTLPRDRREMTVALTLVRDTASSSPCPGMDIPDYAFSTYLPLHIRENTKIPT